MRINFIFAFNAVFLFNISLRFLKKNRFRDKRGFILMFPFQIGAFLAACRRHQPCHREKQALAEKKLRRNSS